MSGIHVNKRRRQGIYFVGFTSGLGGAYLTLGLVGSFGADGVSGRGFLALAAVIFGGWTLKGTIAGVLVFGAFDALHYVLQSLGYDINTQLLVVAAVHHGAGDDAPVRHPQPQAPGARHALRQRPDVSGLGSERLREFGAPCRTKCTNGRWRGVKAIRYEAFGGVDVLEYVDVADPQPGPLDVVVQVGATALNRLDVVQRNGWYQLPGFSLPHISGMDIAGTIVAVGGEVANVAEGDRVVVDPSMTEVPDGSKLAGHDDLYGELGVIGRHPRRRLRRAVPGAGHPRPPCARLDGRRDRRGVPDRVAHGLARADRGRPPRAWRDGAASTPPAVA